MISKIFVATDGSETALKASRYAVGFAKQLGASITILSVIDNRSLASYCTGPYEVPPIHIIESVENFLREAAKRDVARVKNLCDKDGVLCRTVISSGHPAEEIIKYAAQNPFQIIVMASHGRSGFKHLVLGSVAEKVVLQTTTPLLVVKPQEEKSRE